MLQVIDGLDPGGAQTVLLTLLHLIDKERFEVYVANVGRSYDEALLKRMQQVSAGVTLRKSHAIWDVRSLVAVVSALRLYTIDVVHTHLAGADVVGGLAAAATRRPVVSTLHSVAEHRRSYRRARRLLADEATRRLATRLLAVSPAVRESHIADLRLPRHAVDVLANVPAAPLLLEEGFERDRKRAELEIEGAVVTVVSRLTDERDHETLLRALPDVARAHPRVTVLIVGDGPERARLEAIARDLDLDFVRFLGTRADAIEVLAATDIACHPTRYEGMPVTVLDAMSLALPVVATRVPGIIDVVDHAASGLLVPPGDREALAGGLTALLASRELRARLGEEARRRVSERYDPKRWIAAIESLYANLARRGR